MMPEYGPPYDPASLLTRQRELCGGPKLISVNSSWEYWRGDGALVHQDAVTGADLPEDRDARTYLISGTDHIGPMGALKRQFPRHPPPCRRRRSRRLHRLEPPPPRRRPARRPLRHARQPPAVTGRPHRARPPRLPPAAWPTPASSSKKTSTSPSARR